MTGEATERPSSVEAFMAAALYAPEAGYYVRPGRRVGREGDFSTAATLHPALGECVLRWASRRRASRRETLTLIELGAGSGQMAAAIHRAAGWWGRRRLDYRIVEISPSLEAEQRRRLARRRVSWFARVADAVAGVARPVLFSNELVDAFPARQYAYVDGRWQERRVARGPSGRARVVLGPPDPLPPGVTASAFEAVRWPGGCAPPGQVVEVHAAYATWFQELDAALEDGAHLLTIDYGDDLPDLYRRRPHGTLRAYYRHLRFEGDAVFGHPGRMDLTCDVNFTDLVAWGEAAGWQTRGYDVQRDFLMRWLHPRHWRSTHPALRFLLDPDGAGLAFKVLWQEKPAP